MQEPTRLVQGHQQSTPAWLPLPLTPLVGREQEVQAATALLQRSEVRLLTLTGTAGVGKTRLALHIAHVMEEVFKDSVHWVSLEAVMDPALLIHTLAQSLGLEAGGGDPLSPLKVFLRDQQLLLVLDNFEQIVLAAPLLTDLLTACPELKFLITSREALHVRGEYQFQVPPLPLPALPVDGDPRVLHIEEALQNPAVQLLLQRAEAAQANVAITPNNIRSIAEICLRLDGIPLALELAAPRLKLLSPQALLARVDQRLQVLTGGARDVPDRHRTLREAIAWSYGLLLPGEQQLFRRLSIFVGGYTLSAVERVCRHLDGPDTLVLDTLTSLMQKSLVQRRTTSDDEPCFRLLELLREFGLEQLQLRGELEQVAAAHALAYLEVAEEAHPYLAASHQEKLWLQRLENEYDNLRAALRFLIEQGENGQSMEPALRLCGALERYWLPRGFGHEELTWLARALHYRSGVSHKVQARALFCVGDMAVHAGDLSEATARAEELLALCRKEDDLRGCARAQYLQGMVALFRNQAQQATAHLRAALALRREIGDEEGIAWSLVDLSRVAVFVDGDGVAAHTWLAESLAIFEGRRHERGIARVDDLFGSLTFKENDLVAARRHFEKALVLFEDIGVLRGVWNCEANLAQIALLQGDQSAAARYALQCRPTIRRLGFANESPEALQCSAISALAQEHAEQGQELFARVVDMHMADGDSAAVLEVLIFLAYLASAQGSSAWAAKLWGAVQAFREVTGIPTRGVEKAANAREVAAVRVRLGEPAFVAAWEEGHHMTPIQAMSAANWDMAGRRMGTHLIHSTLSPAVPAGLTSRELEVLRLLAKGHTNSQIADGLVITKETVHAHLRSIYRKLGVSTRNAATRYALDHQLG